MTRKTLGSILVTSALFFFTASPASALATRCIGEATILYPDGSETSCSNFCYVYRDDGSYAGYICA